MGLFSGCRERHRVDGVGGRDDEQVALDALCGFIETGFGRTRAASERHRRVPGGVGAGEGVVLIQRAQVLRFSIRPRGLTRRLRGSRDARRRSTEQLNRIQRGWLAASGNTLRGAAPHGRRPHCCCPAAASIISDQRINAEWACSRCSITWRASSTVSRIRICVSVKGISRSCGRLRMNLNTAARVSATSGRV